MSALTYLEPWTTTPTTHPVNRYACAMCECRFEGCDGFICHGLDAD